jgi:hypothetical protein
LRGFGIILGNNLIEGTMISDTDSRFFREMGIQTDSQSVTELMALHNEAIARLKKQHTIDVELLTADLSAARKENQLLRNRLGWTYKALFGCGLFMAYLAKA